MISAFSWQFAAGAAAFLTAFVGTSAATAKLRWKRAIICRDEARIDAVGWLVGAVAYSWLVATSWAWFVGVIGILAAAGPLVSYLARAGVAWRLKVHWSHDEDCEFGPRRKRGGATAKLRSWRKVALRPGLAPS